MEIYIFTYFRDEWKINLQILKYARGARAKWGEILIFFSFN